MANKNQIIVDTQAIVSIVAGTASIVQEYATTVYTTCTCAKCSATYATLVSDKQAYLQLYPHCPQCGEQINLMNITEDPEVIGCQATFLMKDNYAFASFKLTQKALDASDIKQMIKKCDVKHIQ